MSTFAFVIGWLFMMAWGIEVLLYEFTSYKGVDGEYMGAMTGAAMWFSLSAALKLREKK